MSIHEHLPPQARKDLKEVGWTKGLELAKVARAEGQEFRLCNLVALGPRAETLRGSYSGVRVTVTRERAGAGRPVVADRRVPVRSDYADIEVDQAFTRDAPARA